MILKPHQVRRKREAVKVFPDGREVIDRSTAYGRRIYEDRIAEMYLRQGGLCRICHLWMEPATVTFEHEDGKGMGGSHQDDRIIRDGKEYNGAAHLWCNNKKGSRRGYGTATTSAT
jgi:hypothetical protein